jgi:tetratricopeptide (TPR) repeat protein
MQLVHGQTLAAVIEELRADVAGRAQSAESHQEGGGAMPTAHYPTRVPGSPTPPVQPGDDPLVSNGTGPSVRAALGDPRSPAYFRTVAHLAIQAAEALEHAHQLGVVHRDIKPGNLLIENSSFTNDHSPLTTHHSPVHLWVTDFGLAHCQSQAGLTMTGDLLGTLRYMSPEQAFAKRVPVDHRTDIYSLGVTLYELLTLEPAFSGCDRQDLLRQIAFDEPKRPRRLNKSIPLELETIVQKAIEKNPLERYGTAQEMADDLHRFLEDRPIHARRPTLVSRIRKWSRRHRGVVTATVLTTVLALALGTVFFSWQWRVAEDRRIQAEKAEAAAKKAVAQFKAVNDFLIKDLLHQASPYQNPVAANVTVWELLDRAAERIDKNKTLAEQPEVEATIRDALGDTYIDLALFEKAEVHLRRAWDIRRRILGEKHPDTLGTRTLLASNAFFRGKLDEAEKLCRRNLADLLEVVGGKDECTLFTMNKLALVLQYQGQLDEAQSLLRKVYEAGRDGAENFETLRAGNFLAQVLYERGQIDKAETLIRSNLEACRRFHGEHHPETLVALGTLPLLLEARGQWDQAENEFRKVDQIYRRVYGAEHHDTIGNTWSLAVLLHARGKWGEAEPLLRDSVRLHLKVLPKHPNTALALYAWGSFLLDKGQARDAEAELREALQIQRAALVKDHYCTGQTLAALGWAVTKTGRAKSGEPFLREGIKICRKKLPRGDWFTADAESLLGGCLLAQGCYEAAEPLLLHGYQGLQAAAGTPPLTDSWPIRCMLSLHDSPGAPPARILRALDRVIELYDAWGKPDQAAKWRAKRKTIQPVVKVSLQPTRKPEGKWSRLGKAEEEKQVVMGLYNRYCMRCHGVDGRGVWDIPNVPKFTDSRWQARRSDAEIVRAILEGRGGAPDRRRDSLTLPLPSRLNGVLYWAVMPPLRGTLTLEEARRMTGFVRRFAPSAALRFYTARFAADTKPDDDWRIPDHYNAACSAALVGCGQGNDTAGLDDAERARLRRQALDWLRADLTAWGHFLQKQPDEARPRLQRALRIWQQDADFGGVRGDALARLPAAERQAWQQLWADVDQTLKRANHEDTRDTKKKPPR